MISRTVISAITCMAPKVNSMCGSIVTAILLIIAVACPVLAQDDGDVNAFAARQALLGKHAMIAGTSVPAQLVRRSLASKTLGHGVEYSVLLPDDYAATGEQYPLILFLHGAGGDREYLTVRQPQIEAMWRAGVLPPCVVVTVSAGLSFYMNAMQGTQDWESFVVEEFLPFIRSNYNISVERQDIVVTGISMGGFGSALLAFHHPQIFGAVAMMEPVLWPAVNWRDVEPHQIVLPPAMLTKLFGHPVDEAYFADQNPASIVNANPGRLRESELAIYLEVGDEDAFGFHEGAEFLHRALWDNGIRHQYRLVLDGDHIGASVSERSDDRFAFIGRYLSRKAGADPVIDNFRRTRGDADRARGFEPFPFWPNQPVRLEVVE